MNKISKLITLASFFAGMQTVLAVEVPDFALQIDSLLSQISSVTTAIDANKAEYAMWGTKADEAKPQMDLHDAKRVGIMSCLRTNFNTLVATLDACLAEKAQMIENADLQKTDLNNQIEQETSSGKSAIKSKQDSLATCTASLEKLKISIKTLLELDEAKADEIIAAFNLINSKYDLLKAERDVFYVKYQALMTRIQAFEGLMKQDLDKIKGDVCEHAQVC